MPEASLCMLYLIIWFIFVYRIYLKAFLVFAQHGLLNERLTLLLLPLWPCLEMPAVIILPLHEPTWSVIKKISFGGIPNSSSIDILMAYAIFDYMGAFLRSSFAHVDNVIPVIKTITWLLLSRLQGNKPHRNSPEPSEPSGTFLRNLHQHAPELSRTLRNLPRPSGTNLLEPFGTYLLNLRQHTPEPSEIFWNLPPEPTPFYTGTSGTCLRNLHQHTLELPGTFRNLPPEPAPATRTGTHRSLSGLKTPLAYAVGE